MAFSPSLRYASGYLKDANSDESTVRPMEFSGSFDGTRSLANTVSDAFETNSAFAGSGLKNFAATEKADQLVAYYKDQANQINAQKQKKGVGGFLGGLLGLGSTVASFIPGGQAIGIGLGLASKGAGMIG